MKVKCEFWQTCENKCLHSRKHKPAILYTGKLCHEKRVICCERRNSKCKIVEKK